MKKSLKRNFSPMTDIGRCTFSCETRHEKPQETRNSTEHLKQWNKKYEQQSRAPKGPSCGAEHFRPTLKKKRPSAPLQRRGRETWTPIGPNASAPRKPCSPSHKTVLRHASKKEKITRMRGSAATYEQHIEGSGVFSFQSKPSLNTKKEASQIHQIQRSNPLRWKESMQVRRREMGKSS